MVTRYVKHVTGATPQTEAIPGREAEMLRNAGGGYAFDLDDWTRLDRWLTIGTEGGTYYTDERTLTRANARVVERCVAADGLRTVERITTISEAGRAPKNDPAIFALALAAKQGDEPTRVAAYQALPRVCRIGTHLFHFVAAVDAMGGWSRGLRRAVGKWYTDTPVDQLAYQLVKYRQRDGWSHRDVLRLAHPKPVPGDDHGWLLRWAVGKRPEMGSTPTLIDAFEMAQHASHPFISAELVRQFKLPREAVRTEHLNSPEVLEALLYEAPMGTLIRNLGNTTKAGVIAPLSEAVAFVVGRLGDAEAIRKARIHPMAIFLAMSTYASGHGSAKVAHEIHRHRLYEDKQLNRWTPVPQVVDALDAAFYSAMANVAPTGKRLLLAVDVSGSMSSESINGIPAAAAAAAMALIVARTEPNHVFLGVNEGVVVLPISAGMRLDQATEMVRARIGGGTDLSVPYRWLRQAGLGVDAVVTLTDNETWAGRYHHPSEALTAYRKTQPDPVRAVVASMTATQHSVGDPTDPFTLQCVGLDANLPEIIRGFVAGEY